MNRLTFVIALLLTAGVAFGHESENDTKHNAIHAGYIGKICHAHSYGNANGVVQGDFHDHENAYQFGDESHNQKLSDYYLKLHDVNNPDNFNERGELYFDHGLHTPDYIVTPPVQSQTVQSQKQRRGAGVTVEVDPPPESPNVQSRQSVAQCPIGWEIGSPEAIIGAIGYEWYPEGRGYYSLTSVEIYTQQPDTDLSSWALTIGAYLARQTTTQSLQGVTNAFGFYRAQVNPPLRMNNINQGVMGFSVELVGADGKVVDRAVSCYRIDADRYEFREVGRIERIIPNAYGVDVGLPSLLGGDWNAYYRSSWRVPGVAAAPSLRKLKSTTLWAELKKR